MAGSTYGKFFKITTWGESHGKALGVVIDGCPAGLCLDESDIQPMLDLRRPGQSSFSTSRKEHDKVEILSGTFEGETTGTPISMIIKNTNQRSNDYDNISDLYRPGHADYTYDQKYGFRDPRGGGRSSGRETIGRVAAGAVAKKILQNLDIDILCYTHSIGNITIDHSKFDKDVIYKNAMYMPDRDAALKAENLVNFAMKDSDSLGGIIECVVSNMPAGVGEPVFDKLDARLSHAIMSIGAVKGVEFGDGFSSALKTGSANNDQFEEKDGEIIKSSNHAGGILGGISDKSPIIIRAAIKPTPSIAKTQHTVNTSGENTSINISGRHDPVIVPRAVVVVESMTAITLVDMIFESMTSRMESIKKFFSN